MTVDAIRTAHPEATVEIWFQDEARIGLVPVLRRVWAKRGSRLMAVGRRRYEWVYVYGFVRPSTGDVEWLILPTVNVDVFEMSLQYLAQSQNLGPNKRIVLFLDGAGWHKSKKLKVPEGIHLEFLPPYSPELQPAERLWPLLRECVANMLIEEIDALEELLVKRCQTLRKSPEIIREHTKFHWISDDRVAA
jgi:transposase